MVTGIVLLSGCGSPSADTSVPRMPYGMRESVSDREAGRELFMRYCARCHGTFREKRSQVSNRYRSAAPDFTESDYRRANPGALFLAIRQGRVGMPAWAPHFSEKQTWQLVVYLLSRARISLN
jgi:mono/diheme cytochrome c family protein